MDTVVRLISSNQGFLQALALGAALFALYELLVEPDWRQRPAAALARIWIVVLCGVVGVSGLFLGQNAVLPVADLSGVPLGTVQAAFVASLLVAVFTWALD